MANHTDEILKRPLYVFDLPNELLVSLQLKDPTKFEPALENNSVQSHPLSGTSELQDRVEEKKTTTACGLCGVSFQSLVDQRHHAKSDWHAYNLKQKVRGLQPVGEAAFEKLAADLEESISGSESSTSEDDGDEKHRDSNLAAVLKKQARLHDNEDIESTSQKRKRGSGKPPLIWFSTPILPTNVSLGIYRALLTNSEQQELDIIDTLRNKQLPPAKTHRTQNGDNGVPLPLSMTGPNIFLCMIGGGHFAAMVVSLTPKLGKKATGLEERQAIVVAHKTFHRYTTRRKQGGSQSANDSAKGAAHSAGAGIRRYNEAALEIEVRALLHDWKDMIDGCELHFVRATGSTNRRTLFGPYEGQVLHHNDQRNRTFPFSTRRATQAELMRAFVELTRMKVSEVDEAALAAEASREAERQTLQSKSVTEPTKPTVPKLSKEEEAALLHTSQLQALIRRSKAPAVLSYIAKNEISPNFIFQPPTTQANYHASTPLHLAASINSASVVQALLTKGGSDPAILNGEGKPAYDLAGDRTTRDTFRVARSELGEDRWQWDKAHCPSAMTKAQAAEREISERAHVETLEAERRKTNVARLEKESSVTHDGKNPRQVTGKPLGVTEKTGADLREQEARGLTPEMRAKLERERRARAAEERIKRMTRGSGGVGQ